MITLIHDKPGNGMTYQVTRPENCFCRTVTLATETALQTFCNRKPYRQEILKLALLIDGQVLPKTYVFQGKDYNAKIRHRVLVAANLAQIKANLMKGQPSVIRNLHGTIIHQSTD